MVTRDSVRNSFKKQFWSRDWTEEPDAKPGMVASDAFDRLW